MRVRLHMFCYFACIICVLVCLYAALHEASANRFVRAAAAPEDRVPRHQARHEQNMCVSGYVCVCVCVCVCVYVCVSERERERGLAIAVVVSPL